MITALTAAIMVACAVLFWPGAEPAQDFTVWHSYPEGSPQARYIERVAIPSLESRASGVRGIVVHFGEGEIYDRIAGAEGEGALPDVVFLSPRDMARAGQLDVLMPLDNEDGVAVMSEMANSMVGDTVLAGMVDGKAYGLPVDASVQMLLYNPAILADAGLGPPGDMSAFWGILGAPAFSSGSPTGFLLPDTGMKSLAPFLWSTGGELADRKGEKAYGYLNSGRNSKVFENFATAFVNGWIMVAGDKEDALARFAAGEAAMTLASTKDLASFAAQHPSLRYEAAIFPAGDAGSVAVMDCNFAAITKDARKDFAGMFLAGVITSDVMKTATAYPVAEEVIMSARLLPEAFSAVATHEEYLAAIWQIADGSKSAQQALDHLAERLDLQAARA
ncbi:MAG: extracellular solute-binding protein [Clostridiales bacterium]|nr:extracellular solute-binding protein [Clostridiales bacterium]